MDRRIRHLFQEDMLPEIDGEKKKAAIGRICRTAEKQRFCYRPSLCQSLLGQLKYMRTGCMAGQLVCMGIMLAAMLYLRLSPRPFYDYLTVYAAFSSLFGVFLMVELGRTFSNHMWEIEQSCFFSLKQICASRLFVYGGVDLVAILCLAGLTGRETGVGMVRFFVYMMTPFLVCQCIYFFVFFFLRQADKEYIQYGTAGLFGFLAALFTRFPAIYRYGILWAWWLVLAVSAAMLVLEVRKMFKSMEGESVCWN